MSRLSPRCPVSNVVLLPLLVALSLAGGCGHRRVAPDAAYQVDLERWRSDRLAALRSEGGWLTLVGLSWLRPGENRFGSDAGNEIVLGGEGVPALAGTLELRGDGTVVARAAPGAAVSLNGAPVTERPLRADRTGEPDVLRVGRLLLTVIERSGQLGVRARDPQAPARLALTRLESFPADLAFRVRGALEPYPVPREVEVPSAQGPAQKMLVPGVVRFELHGRALRLEPFVGSPGDRTYFFVFGDETNGRETYGAGRFLDAEAPVPGSLEVELDFNRATSPPCAFTPFATCPLPLPGNRLPVRVEAGEKAPPHHP